MTSAFDTDLNTLGIGSNSIIHKAIAVTTNASSKCIITSAYDNPLHALQSQFYTRYVLKR